MDELIGFMYKKASELRAELDQARAERAELLEALEWMIEVVKDNFIPSGAGPFLTDAIEIHDRIKGGS